MFNKSDNDDRFDAKLLSWPIGCQLYYTDFESTHEIIIYTYIDKQLISSSKSSRK